MLSEMFYTLVLTSGIAFVLSVIKIISKSRCDELSCCGCRVHRNVILENQEAQIPETKENV
jgi:hypothetical protein